MVAGLCHFVFSVFRGINLSLPLDVFTVNASLGSRQYKMMVNIAQNTVDIKDTVATVCIKQPGVL